MKIFIPVILFLVSQSAFSNQYFDQFKADKITDNVYVIHGPLEFPNVKNRGFMNNPAFIVADKSVVVIDPGSTYEVGEMVMRVIKTITDKPISHIFNTHVHGDHWLANDIILQHFPKATIIADPRMIEKAKAGEGQNWLDYMIRLTGGLAKGTNIVYPASTAANGEQLNIAGLTFNIHSVGVGHSGTDIMIEYVEGSTMFTGDNVGYQRILRMDDGGFRDIIKSLDKAISLDLKHYVPGHGPSGDVKLVHIQREYFDTLYTQIGIYTDEGLEDFEMKSKIMPLLLKYVDWHGFDDQFGKHISLAKLEFEKAEFE
jgi:glyoxylase-like metal-dependent hydrolase (beta-lactamase superfamily II)